tara:strand:- start:289 stop:897 length:609 start_codon:yes stop_codon:yes gene_type:complete
MGLTLNTNSLNLVSSGDSSSAASGISTSDVTTLIKSNTPWQYITKLTADASSYLEYTSIPSTFYTIRIMYDGLQFSQNTAVRLRLYLDGSLAASYLYRFAGRVSNGSTTSNLYTTNTYWGIAHSHEAGGSRHFMGFTDIGGNTTASQKQMFSRVGSVNSTVPLNYDLSGHYDSGSTQLITGFRLYPASGTFSKGSIKIYGMN